MNKKQLLGLMTIMMVTLMSVSFASCSSDDDDETTYTLKWNFETYGVDDVTLFEYTGTGDKLGSHRVDNLTKNGSYKFTASEKTEKVKIYYEVGGSPRWIQQVFYLKSGSNTDIEVTEHSMVGRKEP